jgi:outer membrane lipoprotein carrier protein
MEKLIATFFTFLFLNSVSAGDINESNFLEFLSKKNFITAEFIQTTFNNGQERKIKGEIKANRRGMFKVIYQEPLNEIITSNGHQLFRLDREIEQLDISEIDATFFESPIGIFSSNREELEDIFSVKECLNDQEVVTCVLEPKAEGSFLKLASIELNNNELSSLVYFDTFEQKVILDFSFVSWDEILDSAFILEIPEGIDVVNH